MKSKITYWGEPDGKFLGYLNEYPDHWTQGDDLEGLKEHLKDLFREFGKVDLPGIKKVEEIEVGVSTGISTQEIVEIVRSERKRTSRLR